MKSNVKFFKGSKKLPIDKFFENVLYDRDHGYYANSQPFGEKGDFITSPKISNLFCEMIAIWMINTWELFGKPKIFSIVELGPGDGSLIKNLLKTFENFPEFNSSKKIYLYEKSIYLKKIQKQNILSNKIKWINNFNKLKKGPVLFFGNEFFDAIPIKQFEKIKGSLFEKNFSHDKKNKINVTLSKATNLDIKIIKSYKVLKKLKFIEWPKFGLKELKKMANKISKFNGCILLIDYGYLKSNNKNTLQSVLKHKKNNLLENLGKADITSHVNFSLLNEFFIKNNLQTKNIITQKQFLENMGILERAKIIARRMKFREQANLYLRLRRLLKPNLMGNLFKVILAYKSNNNKFAGFK